MKNLLIVVIINDCMHIWFVYSRFDFLSSSGDIYVFLFECPNII
ncbi:Uncharacterised protein [Escherichia coli]|nr:Uncharacterised protein [Escherichia coli]